MDTTLIYNQVRIPTDINATVENIPTFPDSIHVFVGDVVNVAQETAETQSFWGMTPEWGAIVIPTVATILVFVIGILLDLLIKWISSVNKTREFRNTFFSWVSIVGDPVSKQISRIRQLATDIHNNTTLQNVRFEFSKSMVDKLDIASAENLIQFFIFRSSKPENDKRSEHAFNIVSILDFLSSVEKEIAKNYEAYQMQSLALMNEWNPIIIHIQDTIHSGHPYREESALFSSIMQSYNAWQQAAMADEEVDVIKVYNLFITPILRGLGTHVFGNAGFEKTDSIIVDLKKLALTYNKWSSLRDGFEEVFSNYADACQTSYVNLCNAINYFKENTRAIK